jgi:hypothetical protein
VNINIGANLVEMIHAKPYRIYLLRRWKWFPRRYWHPIRLSAAIEEEAIEFEKILSNEKKKIKTTQIELKENETELAGFNEFLKNSRKQIVKIGTKTKKEVDNLGSMRQALLRIINKEEKSITTLKTKLVSEKQLVTMCKIKIEEGRYDEVFKLLDVAFSLDNSEGIAGTVEKLKSPAAGLVEKKEQDMVETVENIQVNLIYYSHSVID